MCVHSCITGAGKDNGIECRYFKNGKCSKPYDWIIFQDNVMESEMNVDMKHHRYFVARRGEVLRNIAEEYGGVTVSFPRSGVKSERVIIKGSKDCVEGAKKKIADIVADLVSWQRFCLWLGGYLGVALLVSFVLHLLCSWYSMPVFF